MVGSKLIITEENYEHPFIVGEEVQVLNIHPETLLFVKSLTTGTTGFIIKGEYQILTI